MFRPFVVSTLRGGLRSRVVLTVLLLGLALIGVSYLAGSFSPRQPKTVSLDVGLSLVRVALVLLSLSWVQESMMRDIDRRTVVYLFAYPVARVRYLIGRFLGIIVLSVLATVAFGLLLGISVLAVGGNYEQSNPVALGWGYWCALAGIWLDVCVVTAAAIAVACFATTSALPLVVGLSFAVAGRALGPVFEYLSAGAGGDRELTATYGPLVQSIKWIVPDLSRLDWRVWPLYGVEPAADAVISAVVMASAYIVLLLVLGGWILNRRELN